MSIPTAGQIIDFEEILIDELNVKKVIIGTEEFGLDLVLTDELRAEGVAREIVRHIQAARKDAGLNIDDRIKLSLKTEDDTTQKAIEEHSFTIVDETLATSLDEGTYEYVTSVKIEGHELTISLEKS